VGNAVEVIPDDGQNLPGQGHLGVTGGELLEVDPLGKDFAERAEKVVDGPGKLEGFGLFQRPLPVDTGQVIVG
jgi:hypothetical protein